MTPREQDVERFRDAVRVHFGFSFEDSSRPQLVEVLTRRVAAARTTLPDYLAALEHGASSDELRALAEELTVNETYFFRNVEQIRAFEDVVAAHARDGRSLRVLSAGCASGEEAYSLAITASALLPPSKISILAIDVNRAVLERARRGRYSQWSLRATPDDVRERWFQVDGKELVLAASARERVRFEEQNLVTPRAGLFTEGAFDVIFCRNVLMYFDRDMARAVLARFASSLVPGGHLFLGHAETLRGLSTDFGLLQSHSTFYYRRSAPGDQPETWTTPMVSPARPLSVPSPPLDPPDPDWAESIRDASARIDSLADGRAIRTPQPDPRPLWELERVVELLDQERFAEAWAAFEQRPASTGSDPEVLLIGAVLSTNRGDSAQAERLCRDLLRIDAANAGAHYLYALCKEGAGDHAAAREHDRTALRLDARFAMPRLHLGLLARRAGQLLEARRELAAARTLLQSDDTRRLVMFGGGFNRGTLLRLCEAELTACGGAP